MIHCTCSLIQKTMLPQSPVQQKRNTGEGERHPTLSQNQAPLFQCTAFTSSHCQREYSSGNKERRNGSGNEIFFLMIFRRETDTGVRSFQVISETKSGKTKTMRLHELFRISHVMPSQKLCQKHHNIEARQQSRMW